MIRSGGSRATADPEINIGDQTAGHCGVDIHRVENYIPNKSGKTETSHTISVKHFKVMFF